MVEQPAEPLLSLDASDRALGRSIDKFSSESLMVSLGVVVREVLPQHESQVRFTKGNHVCDALFFDGANGSLREDVQIGASPWQADRLDTCASQQFAKVRGVEWVSVDDELGLREQKAINSIDEFRPICCIHTPSTVCDSPASSMRLVLRSMMMSTR
jgi:hypothetical protein